MPVYDAPPDEGEGAPRQSYNFAPGYNGIVYRAARLRSYQQENYESGASDNEAYLHTQNEHAQRDANHPSERRYKLQSMRWGLIPFWTKRSPDYGSMMKTINCRDDSLIEDRGMWTTMKKKKRCIIVAQGFYEWLNKGKQKIPHFVKRKDGQLMCAAGLWDAVKYEDSKEKLYTYTIITTSSNRQLSFLHDRMPVILDNGTEELRRWLDPSITTWSRDLQGLLMPFKGELEIYPVSQDVGKVGNNSPSFIIPVNSSENKSNIANFFAKGAAKGSPGGSPSKAVKEEDVKVKKEEEHLQVKKDPGEIRETVDHNGTEDNAPLPEPKKELKHGVKRELEDVEEPLSKIPKISATPTKPIATSSTSANPKMRSATSNAKASPKKAQIKAKGTQKITNFFSR
ncbi:hypothetical protein B0O99DRAFT_504485 [Bisporella sp. PMI_857]|nr:hypothetical protein B0O99DRAFT_504485 [Bisporella sp. PMI_857]